MFFHYGEDNWSSFFTVIIIPRPSYHGVPVISPSALAPVKGPGYEATLSLCFCKSYGSYQMKHLVNIILKTSTNFKAILENIPSENSFL